MVISMKTIIFEDCRGVGHFAGDPKYSTDDTIAYSFRNLQNL